MYNALHHKNCCMKKILLVLFPLLTAPLLFAQKAASKEQSKSKLYAPAQKTRPAITRPRTPDEIWGKLFVDVQLNRALGDNKTFVDAVPKYPAATVLSRYAALQKQKNYTAQLKSFVEQNFKVPVNYSPQLSLSTTTLKEHLEALWPILSRKADIKQPSSSLLPLPYPYIVPGGRFREIYYWDSYFTMLGLAESNRFDLIENMLDNFAYLINTYGHIPNGNRSYYLSRSQPPYFALMVQLLQQKHGDRIYKKYLPALQKEYAWWMTGEDRIEAGEQYRRVVKMADGSTLNRYFDDNNKPRQESYYEDVQTGLRYAQGDKMVYTHLRAGAESGWDFSSRWFADTFHINTIETTNIIPVDLNCLLYTCETIIAKAAQSQQQKTTANIFLQKASQRKNAILQYCWNETERFFFDYHFNKQQTTNKWSLAGVMPLFVEIATPQQAMYTQQHISEKFLRDGGVLTTLYATGQQWDAPNGWAPLQFVTIQGLLNYSFPALAKTIADRWMQVNETVYAQTGKMMEKYNVENIHLESGGGEYPSQDGFGWSNGVYLKLYSMFKVQHGQVLEN